MIKVTYLLALFYTVSCQLVKEDDKCRNEKYKILQVFDDDIENGDAPECVYDLKLEKFRFKGVENDEDVEIYKEYVEYLKSLDEETQKIVRDCLNLTGKRSMEKYKDEMQEECRNAIIEFGKKMVKGDL